MTTVKLDVVSHCAHCAILVQVVWEGTTAEFDTTDEPIVRQFASGSLRGPILYV